MRILMLGQFFTPEPDFKGLPFARELVRRGHEVEVLTGFPNYPGGKLYPGYRVRPWRREVLEGITVNRVALYPSHDRSGVRRAANYMSFALSAAAIGPFRVKRPDVAYVYHPPATVGLPATVLRAWHGCPLVYDIQDLWPDSVLASGMMANRWFEAALGRWCRWVYATVDRIVVLSPGFRETLIARGIAAEKIDVIYNWADEASLRGGGKGDRSNLPERPGGCCAQIGPVPFSADRDFGMAGRFNVVFAGTMGLVQKLDAVLEAARICAVTVPDVQFVFVGAGVDKGRLEQRAEELELPNTRFVPRQPMETVGGILSAADVLLVHLQDDPLFRITIPSKTQAYLALGRPILMAVAGDAARLIEQSGGGVICPPENPPALAEAVRRLRLMGQPEREAMGAKGRAFYDRQLSLAVGVEKFERVFEVAVRNQRTKRGGKGRDFRISSAPPKLPDHIA